MAFQTFDTQESGTGTPITVEYINKPGLGWIALLNALLFVLTLSVYRFWGKTNVRRHIWSCVHINGEPLEYKGRGIELFLGFVIVFCVFILPAFAVVLALQLSLGPGHPAVFIANFAILLLVVFFWGMALYRARRYQLSRTLWRGIRGALVGSSLSYSLLYFGAMLLRGVTLGWSTPAMNLNLQERMTGDMRLGSMPFRFKGRAGPLYGPYAVCWVISLFGLIILGGFLGFALYGMFGEVLATERTEPGADLDLMGLFMVIAALIGFLLFSIVYYVIWAFYVAREMSLLASYTTLDLARFQLDATGTSLIWLVLGNMLLMLLTLGIATPFAQQRLVRYFCDRLIVHGIVNVNAIMQSRETVERTGEGLADAFDVGWI
ncbi:MAG: YjgN family protein [Parvibaculaceae bacterium]